MICYITDKLRFRTDDSVIVLESSRVVGEGKNAGTVVWDTMGYYGTYDQLFHALIMRYSAHLLPDTVTTLQLLQDQLEEMLRVVLASVQNLKKESEKENASSNH